MKSLLLFALLLLSVSVSAQRLTRKELTERLIKLEAQVSQPASDEPQAASNVTGVTNIADNQSQAFWHFRDYQRRGFPLDTSGLITVLKSRLTLGQSNELSYPVIRGSYFNPPSLSFLEPDGRGFKVDVKAQAFRIIPVGDRQGLPREVWFCDKDGIPIQVIQLEN